MYPTSRRLWITNRTNSSLSTYESSYNVLPGSDTLATDDLCFSSACASNSGEGDRLDEPFTKGCEKPLLLSTPALCPLDGPGTDDGPASGLESSETDRAESLSLSVSLIVAVCAAGVIEEAEAESVGIKMRSMDVSEAEGEDVRLSTLCLLRARESSGSASRVRVDEGEDWVIPAEGWRKERGVVEREAEAGAYSGEWASASPSSSSDRVRVCGTVLGDDECVCVRCVGDEFTGE